MKFGFQILVLFLLYLNQKSEKSIVRKSMMDSQYLWGINIRRCYVENSSKNSSSPLQGRGLR
jgi:hypothetical protein